MDKQERTPLAMRIQEINKRLHVLAARAHAIESGLDGPKPSGIANAANLEPIRSGIQSDLDETYNLLNEIEMAIGRSIGHLGVDDSIAPGGQAPGLGYMGKSQLR